MHTIVFVLVSLAGTRHAHAVRRIPHTRENAESLNSHLDQDESRNPLKVFATLLQTVNPIVGWQGIGTRSSIPVQTHRVAKAPVLQVTAAPDVESNAMPAAPEQVTRVYPPGCESCQQQADEMAKQNEVNEGMRLAQLHLNNISDIVALSYDYAQYLNDTLRTTLQLKTDARLRSFQLDSSTEPTPLMKSVYNETMSRVPTEVATFICAPEQANLLRTLTGMVRPRRLLDIGSFTGYSSSAILEAVPTGAELTCLDIERDYTRLAAKELSGRNVNFMVGPAIDALRSFEEKGQQFDFVSMDADKPMHSEYFNTSLRLLRPGGMMVMFGMLLFPSAEDEAAMKIMHQTLPNETRILSAQLPLGCGVQVVIKTEGLSDEQAITDEEKAEHKRWQLESEISAIDRYVDGVSSLPAPEMTPQPYSSLGLVAAWDFWQQAMAQAEAEAEAAGQAK